MELDLIQKVLPEEEYNLITCRWGKEDGIFHSYKYVRNKLKLSYDNEKVRKIEDNVIKMINDFKIKLLQCANCSNDLRERGIKKNVYGKQREMVYLDVNMRVERTKDRYFTQIEKPTREELTTFNCGKCGFLYDEKSPIYNFLKYGIDKESVDKFLGRKPAKKEPSQQTIIAKPLGEGRWSANYYLDVPSQPPRRNRDISSGEIVEVERRTAERMARAEAELERSASELNNDDR